MLLHEILCTFWIQANSFISSSCKEDKIIYKNSEHTPNPLFSYFHQARWMQTSAYYSWNHYSLKLANYHFPENRLAKFIPGVRHSFKSSLQGCFESSFFSIASPNSSSTKTV